MAFRENILSLLNPDEEGTDSGAAIRKVFTDPETLKTLSPESQPGAYVTEDQQKRRQDLAEAHKMFFADQENLPLGAEPTPQWKLNKAKEVLDKETAAAVAPLENFYNYQMQGGPVLKLPANASLSQKAY